MARSPNQNEDYIFEDQDRYQVKILCQCDKRRNWTFSNDDLFRVIVQFKTGDLWTIVKMLIDRKL